VCKLAILNGGQLLEGSGMLRGRECCYPWALKGSWKLTSANESRYQREKNLMAFLVKS
jgi:hypothetical protein